MRIAMIVPALRNKGPVIVARDLCIEYCKCGHECVVFYFDESSELEFPCSTVRISWFHRIDFADFDVVHTHMYRPDAYVYFHRLFLKKRPVFVTTVHQHLEEQLLYSDRSKLMYKFLVYSWFKYLQVFDSVVVLSDFHHAYYKTKVSKVYVIFNGRNVDKTLDVDAADKRRLLALKERFICLGVIAYVTRRKGVEQVLRALQDLSGFALLVIGDGPEIKSLQILATKFGVADRCFFLGSRANAYRYLNYVDVFMLCSRAEGFPLSLIEAAAFGKPSVCSNIPAISSVMSSSSVAFYNPDDNKSLVDAVKKAYTQRGYYSEKMKDKYNTDFTVEKMAVQYMKLYDYLRGQSMKNDIDG